MNPLTQEETNDLPKMPARRKAKKRVLAKSIHLQLLSQLAIIDHKLKHPFNPYPVIKKYSDSTANGLEKCIVAFIKFSGGQAERVKNTGRYMDRTKVVSDVLGYNKTIGSSEWIPGTGQNGSADIHSTIPLTIQGHSIGASVKVEVKMVYAKGWDRQSPDQIKYEEQINKAGGWYFKVGCFDQFYELYMQLINKFK